MPTDSSSALIYFSVGLIAGALLLFLLSRASHSRRRKPTGRSPLATDHSPPWPAAFEADEGRQGGLATDPAAHRPSFRTTLDDHFSTPEIKPPLAPPPRVPEKYYLWMNLTAREREIALLVAQYKNSAAIAEELVISPHTVNNHLQHIYAKLQISSRIELTMIARDIQSYDQDTPTSSSLGPPP